MLKKLLLFSFIAIYFVTNINAQTELITNGSFETGNLTGWNTDSVGTGLNPGGCVQNWYIDSTSLNNCCCVDSIVPTDGDSYVHHIPSPNHALVALKRFISFATCTTKSVPIVLS